MTGCTFSGNRATYGAVLFAINSSTTISDSLILNNIADVTGILLINDGALRSHNTSMLNNIASVGIIALTSCTATFEGNTTLTNNLGSLYAVASDLTLEGHVNIANCTPFLTNSQAIPINEGGAITIFQSSVKFNENLTLMKNYAENGGALFISESRVSFSGMFTISNNHVSQAGGGIYLYHSRLNIQGQCRISDNEAREGGGIFGVGSTITLEDVPFSSASVVIFEFNSAKFGGALYLASNTKIYTLLIASLFHHINFTENTADYGGAVYIADETNLSLCNSSGSIVSLQTECFIQILALYPPQLESAIEFQRTAISFTLNSAIVAGEAIFGGLFDRCTVNQLNPKREMGLIQGHLYLESISNINDSDVLASHPVRLCFCLFDQPDCSMKPPIIQVMKGQLFNVSLVAVDQVNHTLASNVTAFLSSNRGGLGEGQQYQSIENMCTNLSYNVFTPHNSEELLLNAVGPCGNAYLSQSRVQLTFHNCTCPIGFQPVAADLETNCKCECHSNITDYVEMCNSTTKTLKTKANTWISNTTISGLGEAYLLVQPHCPYDYCHQDVTVSLNQLNGADDQCAFQRQGTLCGACQTGFSLSFGSSRCIECGRYWPLVLTGITLLAVTAGIVLVSALLFLELTVAAGTLNGVIFYANIVNGNASIYFKQLPTPNFPSLFIAWLNLDVGFDVCLFDNIDAIAKTWLQLAFPIYLIILVVIVIVVSKYSQRFSNMIGKKNPVATLATLILLSYSKILSTAITMLSLITLEYPDGQKVFGKPDATISYLEFPKHIFLFLTGILIVVVGTAYTFILLFWQWLIGSPNWKIFSSVRNPKLLCFVETYHAPFKPKLRFWTGFLLLVRVILYLISALSTTGNPQVPLVTTMIIAGSLLVLSTANAYKKNLVSILEVAIIYNMFVLTAVTWYTTDISANNSRLQSAAIYISTMITFALFCCVIVYHSYMYTRIYYIAQKTKIVRKLNNLKIFNAQPKKKRQNLDLHIEARDVDIFEMIDNSPNTNDYQLAQPQLEPQNITISIIEIPKHKEEKSDS